jgi:DNA excision repair protein ERCC-2
MLDSYMYMENVINHWDQMGVLQKCMEHKLVYLETKDVVETTLALDNYKKACDSGRGAVFLSIARGKVAEGIDFDNHYGRCVVLFGIPYQYTKSHVLRARLDFMREKYQVTRDLCSAPTDLTFPLSSVMWSLLRSFTSFLHAI